MNELSVEQAAAYLGLSDTALYEMIDKGSVQVLGTERPIRLDRAHVVEVHQALRADALHDLAWRRKDPVSLAAEVLRALHPRHTPSTGLPGEAEKRTEFRLGVLPAGAKTLFGVAALRAAASTGDGCKWCLAREFAAPSAFGGWAPDRYSEGFAVLFGQEPCEVCAGGLYGPRMESMRARVHGGARRPSGAAVVPSAADRQAAQEWAQRRPVTASAQPVADDGGKALVARRLREVRARLKDAKRRGDQRHAIELRSLVASLEADAARVDGRRPSAADRPGTLRCGHQLAAGCSCPRRAPGRGRR